MTTIRCPNCGKDNPDLLDVCQFCQTPLKPDAALQSGQTPTKKNTGELEPILPDWLKDVRQQARDSADEDAAQASQPGGSQDEPADFLAGLASQAGSGSDEDVPDWLASLTPSIKPAERPPATPETDSESPQEEATSSVSGLGEQTPADEEKDELSAWLSHASEQQEDTVEFDPSRSQRDTFDSFDSSPDVEGTPAPKEEEDLSWLYNLEAAAKQTGELQKPKQGTDWTADFETPSAPTDSSSQGDLSWLDRLGGIEETSQPAQPFESPASSGEEPGWLNQLGGISEPSQPAATEASQDPAPHEASPQDLSWLDKLGTESGHQSFDAAPEQPAPAVQPFERAEDIPAPGEDLSWLDSLGKPGQPAEPPGTPAASHEASPQDLSWLDSLGGEPEPLSVPPFAEEIPEAEDQRPRQTAPLNDQQPEESQPDWLKSATEAPTMPPPGDPSLDWFSSASQPPKEKTPPPASQMAPFDAGVSSTPEESAALSNQDVDSLFSVDLPDWLSRPEPEGTTSQAQRSDVAPAESDESLTPADLPSWVQAMRPVEAVISETTPSVEDQPAETEGPLAGLHSVIPIAPIGSSRRPKPVSLTLQVSDEQQTSVALLEQILGSETSPRALITPSVVQSQQWLRWALSGLVLLVLSGVIFLRSQLMPVSAVLPGEASSLTNSVMGIPAGANILVVVDYEPSLAGEMEAISAPLLDQLVLLSQPNLSFISTSPNGAALVERLLVRLNQPGIGSTNLGFLPGGSAGVLGFLEVPGQIVPLADVQSFSEYSALVVLTDHAESGRVWVEQLQGRKQIDPALANQPLLVVASAQAGPLLQPYVSSGQVTAMLSGLSAAARYEAANSRPGIAHSYWDTFGIGLMMAVALIVAGSLWSLFTGLRARRAHAEQG